MLTDFEKILLWAVKTIDRKYESLMSMWSGIPEGKAKTELFNCVVKCRVFAAWVKDYIKAKERLG